MARNFDLLRPRGWLNYNCRGSKCEAGAPATRFLLVLSGSVVFPFCQRSLPRVLFGSDVNIDVLEGRCFRARVNRSRNQDVRFRIIHQGISGFDAGKWIDEYAG